MPYSIQLDCAPMTPRPDTLLPDVLKDTGIVLGEPDSMLFGCWSWTIPPEQEAAYCAARDTIRERIEALYHNGAIRFGGW